MGVAADGEKVFHNDKALITSLDAGETFAQRAEFPSPPRTAPHYILATRTRPEASFPVFLYRIAIQRHRNSCFAVTSTGYVRRARRAPRHRRMPACALRTFNMARRYTAEYLPALQLSRFAVTFTGYVRRALQDAACSSGASHDCLCSANVQLFLVDPRGGRH